MHLSCSSYTCISAAASTDDLSIVLQLIAKGGDLMASDAFDMWGRADDDADDDRHAEHKAIATAAWLEGPHPSQVKRRADERWARRWPFMQVAVGHGFQPLAYRRALLEAAALPPSAVIPSQRISGKTRAQRAMRHAYLLGRVLGLAPVWKQVTSYL